MNLTSREQLLHALGRERRRYRLVTLLVSDTEVRIRSLTEGELSAYQRRMFAKNGRGWDSQGMQSANRRLFVLCIVDSAGNRMFADHDADKLATMDAADASTLYEACAEHTGLDRTDLGDLAKNSDMTDGDDLPSD